ncbi:MAG: hypothetical protein SF069_00305 [Phycisphaerae bacterium]|nr:hypothetical protein [Phycisphaerae bacterium]
MARGSLNIFELHIEKLLLGLVGAFAIFMIVQYFILNPNTVEYGGEKVGPSEVREKILAKARSLDSRLKSAQPQATPVPKLTDTISSVLANGVFKPSAEKQPAIPSQLATATPFGVTPPSFEDEGAGTQVVLVKPLAPVGAVAETGRALVSPTRPTIAAAATPGGRGTDAPRATGDGKEITWVSVAAWFPNGPQEKEMLDAGYPPFRAKVYVSRVEAQRQELLADGSWSDWSDVSTSEAMPEFDVPAPALDDGNQMVNRAEIDEAYKTVKSAQLSLMQPKFYQVMAGDYWRLPALEGVNVDALKTTDLPEKPPTPPQPPGGTAEPPAPGGTATPPSPEPAAEPGTRSKKEILAAQREKLKTAEAAIIAQKYDEALTAAKAVLAEKATGDIEKQAQSILERAEDALFSAKLSKLEKPVMHASDEQTAIWFHDDTVEPGKTYRYRVRVALWNRFVGRPRDLKDPEGAKLAILPGEWSLPTQPVTVRASVAYFLANASGTSGAARVDVFKWRAGTWLKSSFEVATGDVIGGPKKVGDETIDFSTGAVVLDIAEAPDFAARNRKTKDGQFEYRKSPNLVLTYLDPLDGRIKQMHYDKYDPMAAPIREAAQ